MAHLACLVDLVQKANVDWPVFPADPDEMEHPVVLVHWAKAAHLDYPAYLDSD